MSWINFNKIETTKLKSEIISVIFDYQQLEYGDLFGINALSRKSQSIIESVRLQLAEFNNSKLNEIFFTNDVYSAYDYLLEGYVYELGINTIFYQYAEFDAILNNLKRKNQKYNLKLVRITYNSDYDIDIDKLKKDLEKHDKSLLILSHANPYTSNLIPVKKISKICNDFNSYFHLDLQLTMGLYEIDFSNLEVSSAFANLRINGGPASCGFIYLKQCIDMQAVNLLTNKSLGSIEANRLNIPYLVGMLKAMELLHTSKTKVINTLSQLKLYYIKQLKNADLSYEIIGNQKKSNYPGIININFNTSISNKILLIKLELNRIIASSGNFKNNKNFNCIRFSFNNENTFEEIDELIKTLKKIID